VRFEVVLFVDTFEILERASESTTLRRLCMFTEHIYTLSCGGYLDERVRTKRERSSRHSSGSPEFFRFRFVFLHGLS